MLHVLICIFFFLGVSCAIVEGWPVIILLMTSIIEWFSTKLASRHETVAAYVGPRPQKDRTDDPSSPFKRLRPDCHPGYTPVPGSEPKSNDSFINEKMDRMLGMLLNLTAEVQDLRRSNVDNKASETELRRQLVRAREDKEGLEMDLRRLQLKMDVHNHVDRRLDRMEVSLRAHTEANRDTITATRLKISGLADSLKSLEAGQLSMMARFDDLHQSAQKRIDKTQRHDQELAQLKDTQLNKLRKQLTTLADQNASLHAQHSQKVETLQKTCNDLVTDRGGFEKTVQDSSNQTQQNLAAALLKMENLTVQTSLNQTRQDLAVALGKLDDLNAWRTREEQRRQLDDQVEYLRRRLDAFCINEPARPTTSSFTTPAAARSVVFRPAIFTASTNASRPVQITHIPKPVEIKSVNSLLPATPPPTSHTLPATSPKNLVAVPPGSGNAALSVATTTPTEVSKPRPTTPVLASPSCGATSASVISKAPNGDDNNAQGSPHGLSQGSLDGSNQHSPHGSSDGSPPKDITNAITECAPTAGDQSSHHESSRESPVKGLVDAANESAPTAQTQGSPSDASSRGSPLKDVANAANQSAPAVENQSSPDGSSQGPFVGLNRESPDGLNRGSPSKDIAHVITEPTHAAESPSPENSVETAVKENLPEGKENVDTPVARTPTPTTENGTSPTVEDDNAASASDDTNVVTKTAPAAESPSPEDAVATEPVTPPKVNNKTEAAEPTGGDSGVPVAPVADATTEVTVEANVESSQEGKEPAATPTIPTPSAETGVSSDIVADTAAAEPTLGDHAVAGALADGDQIAPTPTVEPNQAGVEAPTNGAQVAPAPPVQPGQGTHQAVEAPSQEALLSTVHHPVGPLATAGTGDVAQAGLQPSDDAVMSDQSSSAPQATGDNLGNIFGALNISHPEIPVTQPIAPPGVVAIPATAQAMEVDVEDLDEEMKDPPPSSLPPDGTDTIMEDSVAHSGQALQPMALHQPALLNPGQAGSSQPFVGATTGEGAGADGSMEIDQQENPDEEMQDSGLPPAASAVSQPPGPQLWGPQASSGPPAAVTHDSGSQSPFAAQPFGLQGSGPQPPCPQPSPFAVPNQFQQQAATTSQNVFGQNNPGSNAGAPVVTATRVARMTTAASTPFGTYGGSTNAGTKSIFDMTPFQGLGALPQPEARQPLTAGKAVSFADTSNLAAMFPTPQPAATSGPSSSKPPVKGHADPVAVEREPEDIVDWGEDSIEDAPMQPAGEAASHSEQHGLDNGTGPGTPASCAQMPSPGQNTPLSAISSPVVGPYSPEYIAEPTGGSEGSAEMETDDSDDGKFWFGPGTMTRLALRPINLLSVRVYQKAPLNDATSHDNQLFVLTRMQTMTPLQLARLELIWSQPANSFPVFINGLNLTKTTDGDIRRSLISQVADTALELLMEYAASRLMGGIYTAVTLDKNLDDPVVRGRCDNEAIFFFNGLEEWFRLILERIEAGSSESSWVKKVLAQPVTPMANIPCTYLYIRRLQKFIASERLQVYAILDCDLFLDFTSFVKKVQEQAANVNEAAIGLEAPTVNDDTKYTRIEFDSIMKRWFNVCVKRTAKEMSVTDRQIEDARKRFEGDIRLWVQEVSDVSGRSIKKPKGLKNRLKPTSSSVSGEQLPSAPVNQLDFTFSQQLGNNDQNGQQVANTAMAQSVEKVQHAGPPAAPMPHANDGAPQSMAGGNDPRGSAEAPYTFSANTGASAEETPAPPQVRHWCKYTIENWRAWIVQGNNAAEFAPAVTYGDTAWVVDVRYDELDLTTRALQLEAGVIGEDYPNEDGPTHFTADELTAMVRAFFRLIVWSRFRDTFVTDVEEGEREWYCDKFVALFDRYMVNLTTHYSANAWLPTWKRYILHPDNLSLGNEIMLDTESARKKALYLKPNKLCREAGVVQKTAYSRDEILQLVEKFFELTVWATLEEEHGDKNDYDECFFSFDKDFDTYLDKNDPDVAVSHCAFFLRSVESGTDYLLGSHERVGPGVGGPGARRRRPLLNDDLWTSDGWFEAN